MQREPSEVTATSTTQPLCPASEAVQRPVSTSHTRAVKSSPAVMARRASGVSATAHTPASVQARLSALTFMLVAKHNMQPRLSENEADHGSVWDLAVRKHP